MELSVFIRLALRNLFLVTISVISGCAFLPNVELDKSNASSIRKIAMLEIKPPRSIEVENFGVTAELFGLVGWLAEKAATNRSEIFQKALADQQVPITAHLRTSIEDNLRNQKYEVSYLNGQQSSRENDAEGDYADVETDADVLLNVWITQFGYISPKHWSIYIPYVVVRARMVDAKTRKEVYFKTYVCGWGRERGDPDHVLPTETFPSFDVMMTSIPAASAGLLACETGIAKLIGRDLKSSAVD